MRSHGAVGPDKRTKWAKTAAAAAASESDGQSEPSGLKRRINMAIAAATEIPVGPK